MISSLTQTILTTESAVVGEELQLQERRHDVVLTVPAGHRVTLDLLGRSLELDVRPTDDDGAIDWASPDRETVRLQFYSASPDVIASAVVQYLARQHGTKDSKFCSDAERSEAVERLRRFAGAMGLDYAAA